MSKAYLSKEDEERTEVALDKLRRRLWQVNLAVALIMITLSLRYGTLWFFAFAFVTCLIAAASARLSELSSLDDRLLLGISIAVSVVSAGLIIVQLVSLL